MSDAKRFKVADLYHSCNQDTIVVNADQYDAAQSQLAALRGELAKVIEDRARFPDRPDFIGHMIGSHIGNLKAGKESSDNYARKWYDRMTVAEQRLADAERRNAVADIESAAKVLASCMDYPWEHMPENGRALMRKHAKDVIDAALNPNPEAASHDE
ncbi:hypothetical protein D3C84_786400 [compost metagenome]